tara:strand:+ start:1308 stop:1931 length:624 start_codon:yes stop_codon:yes gene_type:complete
MSLSHDLWERNFDLALESLNTKFVQGIKTGKLPKIKFQLYVAQDYYFLESFARAYGLAISKCEDKISIKVLSELLLGVSEELLLHESYSKKWDINLQSNVIRTETKNYTDFLENTSKNNSYIEILSAMMPCMRLYSWIGQSLIQYKENNSYKDWIVTYSDSTFDQLAKSLEELIDQKANYSQFDELNVFYEKAMRLELDFFDAYSDF